MTFEKQVPVHLHADEDAVCASLAFYLYFDQPPQIEFGSKVLNQNATPCFIGSAQCNIRKLQDSPTGVSLPLRLTGASPDNPFRSHINISCSLSLDARQNVRLRFAAQSMGIGSCDSFIRLSRSAISDVWSESHTVFHTEIVADKPNPKWRASEISVHKLCRGDLKRPVFCAWFRWERNGEHTPLGFAKVTLTDLLIAGRDSSSIPLIHPELGEVVGTLKVPLAELCSPHTSDRPSEPTYSTLFRPTTIKAYKITPAKKVTLTMRLTEKSGVVTIGKGGRTDALYMYDRITNANGTSEGEKEELTIIRSNAEGKEVGQSFEISERHSHNLVIHIRRRIEYLRTGVVPLGFLPLKSSILAAALTAPPPPPPPPPLLRPFMDCLFGCGKRIFNDDMAQHSPAGSCQPDVGIVPDGYGEIHSAPEPPPDVKLSSSCACSAAAPVVGAIAARHGWTGDAALKQLGDAAAACYKGPLAVLPYRHTKSAWGRWPDPQYRKLGKRKVRKLKMPPLPTNSRHTSSTLLSQEHRKRDMPFIKGLVDLIVDKTVQSAEGTRHAASRLASVALSAALGECQYEMVREILYGVVDEVSTWGAACQLACETTMDAIIEKIEIQEIMDFILWKIEIDDFYYKLHRGSVPRLDTLALRAALTTAAGDTLGKIMKDPVLVRMLADISMLPFMLDLLMNRANHEALHYAPVARRHEYFFALHEDHRGIITGHPIMLTKRLTVELIVAKDLGVGNDTKASQFMKPNAYATVTCGENTEKTKVVKIPTKGTLEGVVPPWDTKLELMNIGSRLLTVHVYQHISTKESKLLGEVLIEIEPNKNIDAKWYPLQPTVDCPEVQGEVKLGCSWAGESPETPSLIINEHTVEKIELKIPSAEEIAARRSTEIEDAPSKEEVDESAVAADLDEGGATVDEGQFQEAGLQFRVRGKDGFRLKCESKMRPDAVELGSGIWSGSIAGQFAGYRMPTMRGLTVRVVEARGMPTMDATGSGDPYAICRFAGRMGAEQDYTTHVQFDNKRPKWNEQFNFGLVDRDSVIVIEIWDHDVPPPPAPEPEPEAEGGLMIEDSKAKETPKEKKEREKKEKDVKKKKDRAEREAKRKKEKAEKEAAKKAAKKGKGPVEKVKKKEKVKGLIKESDKPIGHVVVKIEDIIPSADGQSMWLPLRRMLGMEEGQKAGGDVRLHLTCPYVMSARQLRCIVVGARGLDEEPVNAFAVVQCEKTFKTGVKYTDRGEATWDQEFEIEVECSSAICITLYSKVGRGKNSKPAADVTIGRVIVNLVELDPGQPAIDDWFVLQPVPGQTTNKVDGEIRIGLSWQYDCEGHRVEHLEHEHDIDELEGAVEDEEDELDGLLGGRGYSVTIMDAEGLKKMDIFGKNDPYCTVTILGKTRRTSTVWKGGAAPLWNDGLGEQMDFIGLTEEPEELEIVVYDEDKYGSDDLIGTIKFGLQDAKMCPADEDWKLDRHLQLTHPDKKGNIVVTGDLHVSICGFESKPPPRPLERQLYVTIKQATELKSMDLIGQNDPYVSLTIAGVTKKTTTIPKTNNPKWRNGVGETLTFSMTEVHETIDLKVYDEDIGKDDFIGSKAVPLNGMHANKDWKLKSKLEITNQKGHKTGNVMVEMKWEKPPRRANENKRILKVTVVQGSNLKKMDLFGQNDVYCIVDVDGKLKKTKTIDEGGSAPKWRGGAGELLEFKGLEEVPETLELRVFDEDVGCDDFIGSTFVDLKEKPIAKDWEMDKFFPIVDGKGRSTGPCLPRTTTAPHAHTPTHTHTYPPHPPHPRTYHPSAQHTRLVRRAALILTGLQE